MVEGRSAPSATYRLSTNSHHLMHKRIVNITKVFGDNVRALRMKRGLSQEALAELAGLHRTYIGAVERGERNITLRNAERIAKALHTSLTEFLHNRES